MMLHEGVKSWKIYIKHIHIKSLFVVVQINGATAAATGGPTSSSTTKTNTTGSGDYGTSLKDTSLVSRSAPEMTTHTKPGGGKKNGADYVSLSYYVSTLTVLGAVLFSV